MDTIFAAKLERIEQVLAQALPEAADTRETATWAEKVFGTLPAAVNAGHMTDLIGPCRALILQGGKRWRCLLLVLCAEAVSGGSGSIDTAYALTPLVEFVHTASLIHDDIEDNADTRRGKPAAHITWGLDTALNAGSWLYFTATACIENDAVPEQLRLKLFQLYVRELRRLHLGQAMDIHWHRNPRLLPTADEYMAMVRSKTGTLASFAAQAGVLAGGGTQETALRAGTVAADIGAAFQILDDVQNLTTGNPGKKRGDDIVEGKKSLPVLMHLQENPQDAPLIASYMEAAARDGVDAPQVELCIKLLESSGSVSKSFAQGKALVQKKSAELADLLHAQDKLIPQLFSGMLPSL